MQEPAASPAASVGSAPHAATPPARSAAPQERPIPAPAHVTPALRAGPDIEAQEPLTLPEELFQPGLAAPGRRRFWLAANVALILGLAAQAAWFFPTQIAMQAPALRPTLQQYCGWLGCVVGLPRLPDQIFIEASDLQLLDAARPGQVLLTATVRNRAVFAQEFPLLELTLTGAENQTAARRVFAPSEYLDTAMDPARGIGAQQEVSIRLYLDTAELRATGYRLYLFFA
jgi:hypothetical protein